MSANEKNTTLALMASSREFTQLAEDLRYVLTDAPQYGPAQGS